MDDMKMLFSEKAKKIWQDYLDAWTGMLHDEEKLRLKRCTSIDECFKFCGCLIRLSNVEEVKAYFDMTDRDDKTYKSACSSGLRRRKGNKYFESKEYLQSVQCYTESILHAPCKSEELSLAYANRSASLYHLKEYQLCLDDITRALTNGYPADSLYKLHQREGQCYYFLGRKEETENAFNIALGLLSNSEDEKTQERTVRTKRIINEWKERKAQDNRGEQPVTSDVHKVLPVVSYGSNDVLLQATCAIHMEQDGTHGRFLVASQDIHAGDTLIVEKPYASVLLPNNYGTHCHHCYTKLTLASLPCSQCTRVQYCSEVCRKASWDSYHSMECPYLDLLHSVGIAHLSLRIVLITGLDCLLDFRKKTHPASQQTYDNSYKEVYSLLSHFEETHPVDLFQYSMTAHLLLNVLNNCSFFPDDVIPEIKDYVGSIMMRHILQLVCNAHAITELQTTQLERTNVQDQSQVRIATAVYPTVSLCNHSCDPNIISSFQGDVLVVKAERDIMTNADIFNCYGPHCKRMLKSERQQILLDQYFFHCYCSACNESTDEEKIKALKCPKCDGPLGFPKPLMTCFHCGIETGSDKQKLAVLEACNVFEEACTLMENNQYEESLVKLHKCHDIRSRVLYCYNVDFAHVKDCLARCYTSIGNYKKAALYLSQSICIDEKIYGSNSIEVANELQKYAEVLANAGDFQKSQEVASRATDIFILHYGKTHQSVDELRRLQEQLDIK